MYPCMPLLNDTVLVDKNRRGVNAKLEIWREALESRRFSLSRSKKKHMKCNFSKRRGFSDSPMVMASFVVSHVCGSNPASPSPIIYLSKKLGKRKNKDEGIVNLDGLEISKIECFDILDQ